MWRSRELLETQQGVHMAVHTQHETLATLRKAQGHLLATTVPLPCLRALPLPVHESRAHQTAPRRGATCRSQVSLLQTILLELSTVESQSSLGFDVLILLICYHVLILPLVHQITWSTSESFWDQRSERPRDYKTLTVSSWGHSNNNILKFDTIKVFTFRSTFSQPVIRIPFRIYIY